MHFKYFSLIFYTSKGTHRQTLHCLCSTDVNWEWMCGTRYKEHAARSPCSTTDKSLVNIGLSLIECNIWNVLFNVGGCNGIVVNGSEDACIVQHIHKKSYKFPQDHAPQFFFQTSLLMQYILYLNAIYLMNGHNNAIIQY